MSLHSECERQIMQAGQSEMITALNVYDKWDKMSHKKKSFMSQSVRWYLQEKASNL